MAGERNTTAAAGQPDSFARPAVLDHDHVPAAVISALCRDPDVRVRAAAAGHPSATREDLLAVIDAGGGPALLAAARNPNVDPAQLLAWTALAGPRQLLRAIAANRSATSAVLHALLTHPGRDRILLEYVVLNPATGTDLLRGVLTDTDSPSLWCLATDNPRADAWIVGRAAAAAALRNWESGFTDALAHPAAALATWQAYWPRDPERGTRLAAALEARRNPMTADEITFLWPHADQHTRVHLLGRTNVPAVLLRQCLYSRDPELRTVAWEHPALTECVPFRP